MPLCLTVSTVLVSFLFACRSALWGRGMEGPLAGEQDGEGGVGESTSVITLKCCSSTQRSRAKTRVWQGYLEGSQIGSPIESLGRFLKILVP